MYHDIDDEEELPEWVRNEKEQFSKFRDKDGDGYLNVEEVSTVFYHRLIFNPILFLSLTIDLTPL